jgi:hypothetical protein
VPLIGGQAAPLAAALLDPIDSDDSVAVGRAVGRSTDRQLEQTIPVERASIFVLDLDLDPVLLSHQRASLGSWDRADFFSSSRSIGKTIEDHETVLFTFELQSQPASASKTATTTSP